MTDPIWTQTYDVNTIVLDSQKRLGLFGVVRGQGQDGYAEGLGEGGCEAYRRRGLATPTLVVRQGDRAHLSDRPRCAG